MRLLRSQLNMLATTLTQDKHGNPVVVPPLKLETAEEKRQWAGLELEGGLDWEDV